MPAIIHDNLVRFLCCRLFAMYSILIGSAIFRWIHSFIATAVRATVFKKTVSLVIPISGLSGLAVSELATLVE